MYSIKGEYLLPKYASWLVGTICNVRRSLFHWCSETISIFYALSHIRWGSVVAKKFFVALSEKAVPKKLATLYACTNFVTHMMIRT